MSDISKKTENSKPYTEDWERIANGMARSFAPPIKPCRECGYPVISGYCCTGCGSDMP